MTTSGTKGQHFNCQMKMKAEVACAHDVKITATAGLTIDKAGVVGAELGYNYPAGQGLIAQDVGILPTSCGSGKLFAAITSPYFVTPSGLKIKRDVINIQVDCEEPDGWKGTDHGLAIGNGARQVDSRLYYKYTDIAGVGASLYYRPIGCAGNLSDLTIVGPGSAQYIQGISSSGRNVSIPPGYPGGVYILRPFCQPSYGPATLGNLTFTINANSTSVKQRGIAINASASITKALGESFSKSFGEVVDSYSPLLTFTMGTYRSSDILHPEAPTFNGSVIYSGDTFTATGMWQWGIFGAQYTQWGRIYVTCTATYDGQLFSMEGTLTRS